MTQIIKLKSQPRPAGVQPSSTGVQSAISTTFQTQFKLTPINLAQSEPISKVASSVTYSDSHTRDDETLSDSELVSTTADTMQSIPIKSTPEEVDEFGKIDLDEKPKIIKQNLHPIISDTNLDYDEKIRNGTKPEHYDKKKLQQRIKQLDKKQQLQLFHTIIKPLNIYKVTNTGTFFDLNELTPEQFWKLSYHINLTFDCINRGKIISEFEREHSNLYQLDPDLISVNDNDLDSLMTLKGLNRISVFPSSFNQNREQLENKNFTSHEYESKVLERNVYTDKRRQKPEPKPKTNKTTRVSKISKT